MRGKNYAKLGKTKLVRVPQGVEQWIKLMSRELDTKEDPQAVMDLLMQVASRSK